MPARPSTVCGPSSPRARTSATSQRSRRGWKPRLHQRKQERNRENDAPFHPRPHPSVLPAPGPHPPRRATNPGSVRVLKPAPPPARRGAPAPAVPAPGSAPAAGEGAGGEATTPASQALYDRGYTLFYQGHFVDAETSFQRFLQVNPKSELADNAQYWIGECPYSPNRVKGTLPAFPQRGPKY